MKPEKIDTDRKFRCIVYSNLFLISQQKVMFVNTLSEFEREKMEEKELQCKFELVVRVVFRFDLINAALWTQCIMAFLRIEQLFYCLLK